MIAVSARPPSTLRLVLVAGGLVLLAALGLVASNGNPAVALAPLGLWGAVAFVRRAQVRTLFLAALLLALCADYIPERVYEGHWQSPMYLPGRLLFELLHVLTGISPLRAQGMDLIVLGLLALWFYRRATRQALDPAPVPITHVLPPFVALSMAGLLFSVAWGAVRGGNVKESMWQVHVMLMWPLVWLLAAKALRGSADLAALGRIVVAAGLFKAALSVYFIHFVVRPRGLLVEFATSHSDTLIYVAGVVLLVVRYLEEPSRRRAWRTLPLLAGLAVGLYLNDRRLAYASLGFSLVAVVALLRQGPARRTLLRMGMLLLPFIPPYLAVGWGRQGSIWGPAATFRGMFVGEASGVIDYRDLENFNIIMSWMQNPVLGSGYGHEFVLAAPLPDISFALPTWRYHPHNQLLWLWSNGGLVGWTMVWLVIIVLVFLAVRTYRMAATPLVRSAALTCVCMVLAWANQTYGDMGNLSWYGTFTLALVAAVTGQLAWETGAWPRRPARAPLGAMHPRAEAADAEGAP